MPDRTAPAFQTKTNRTNPCVSIQHFPFSKLLVTHYQRLLNYIVPDRVHVLQAGRIVKSGDKSLALELEEKGYTGIEAKVG